VQVPVSLSCRRAYHFTHIDNLPSIVANGLLARNHPAFPSEKSKSVADAGLQRRRSLVRVPCGPGGFVHDYVPLYFGSRSPMLFSITNRQEVAESDIAYFEFPIALAEQSNAVFTRASAHTIDAGGFFENPTNLAVLDWQAIDALEPECPVDSTRHQRMAELLVHWHLPISAAIACVARNDDCARRIEDAVGCASFPPIELQSSERIHWF
jgi:hypothetical protein